MINKSAEIRKIKKVVEMLNCDEGEWNTTEKIIAIENMDNNHLLNTYDLLLRDYNSAETSYIRYDTATIKELLKNKAIEILNAMRDKKMDISKYKNDFS